LHVPEPSVKMRTLTGMSGRGLALIRSARKLREGKKMRRGTTLLAAIAVVVTLFAGAAYAAVLIEGDANNNILFESPNDDIINGGAGNDKIWAQAFPYDIDELRGNSGRDLLDAQDQDQRDTLNGGANFDRCIGDKGDTFIDCEIIE
jgi:Ca2+-binding RTX toxin-like protein